MVLLHGVLRAPARSGACRPRLARKTEGGHGQLVCPEATHEQSSLRMFKV